jgi:tetratricopeptide (TPR) repeat protein
VAEAEHLDQQQAPQCQFGNLANETPVDEKISAPSSVPVLSASHDAGMKLFRAGRVRDALPFFAQAVRDCETSEHWNDWATALLLCGDSLMAEHGFRRAVELDSQNRQATANLGVLLASERRTFEAVPFLERGLRAAENQERTVLGNLLNRCRTQYDRAAKIAFLICTETSIEKNSILLARSIRRFGGSLRHAPIYSFAPRPGLDISREAQSQFQVLDVIHQARPLNTAHPQMGIANKPFVCAYAEEFLEADVSVFLDSDKVVFNEPRALLVSDKVSAAVRPVDSVNIGVAGFGEGQNGQYWRDLYATCGVDTVRFVRTMIDGTKIFDYFNSGMIAAHRNNRLFSKWAKIFDRTMRSGATPTDPFFIEQSSLAGTISGVAKDVAILPPSYNYPIFAQNTLSPESRRFRSFDDMVSIHYHHFFKDGNWRALLDGLWSFDRTSERYRWLTDNLRALNF